MTFPNNGFGRSLNDTPIFPITGLSLMTSCGCNLKCEYCLIDKAKKYNPKAAAELQKNTIQALKDNSFCDNAKKTVIAMGGTPNDIIRIELWGQEQTLTLEHFYGNIEYWLDTFPNWSELSFSTNGQAFPEKIITLITELDKHLTHEMVFSLQWSYDGSFSGEEMRHDDDNKVIQNLTKCIEALNQIKLNNIQVDFYLHGVISYALIHHLGGDIDKIKQYWEECRATANSLPLLSTNEKVNMFNNYSVAEEVPYRASVQDGFDYYDFFIKSAIVGGDIQGLDFLSGQWSRIVDFAFPDMAKATLDDIVEWLNEKVNNDEDREILNNQLSNGFFCGTGLGELKLLYDGSTVNCQNSIFERTLDTIDPNGDPIETGAKKTWVEKNFFFNPQTATEEEIQKYKYIFSAGRTNTFWHTYNTTLAKIHYLALAGQIDPEYMYNLKLAIKHAYIITYINQCMYNNMIYTGSAWSKDTGVIRRYCNGVAKYSESHENNNRMNSLGGTEHKC